MLLRLKDGHAMREYLLRRLLLLIPTLLGVTFIVFLMMHFIPGDPVTNMMVKFHDGTDFDAAAAKWNFDRILDPEVKSWVRPYYEEIDTVEAVDKYTLRIQMKEPSGALPIVLSGYFQG